jgi:hypothetical protein
MARPRPQSGGGEWDDVRCECRAKLHCRDFAERACEDDGEFHRTPNRCGVDDCTRGEQRETRVLPMATLTALAALAVIEVEPAVMRAGFAGSPVMIAAVACETFSEGANIADSTPSAQPIHPSAIEDASQQPTIGKGTESQNPFAPNEFEERRIRTLARVGAFK